MRDSGQAANQVFDWFVEQQPKGRVVRALVALTQVEERQIRRQLKETERKDRQLVEAALSVIGEPAHLHSYLENVPAAVAELVGQPPVDSASTVAEAEGDWTAGRREAAVAAILAVYVHTRCRPPADWRSQLVFARASLMLGRDALRRTYARARDDARSFVDEASDTCASLVDTPLPPLASEERDRVILEAWRVRATLLWRRGAAALPEIELALNSGDPRAPRFEDLVAHRPEILARWHFMRGAARELRLEVLRARGQEGEPLVAALEAVRADYLEAFRIFAPLPPETRGHELGKLIADLANLDLEAGDTEVALATLTLALNGRSSVGPLLLSPSEESTIRETRGTVLLTQGELERAQVEGQIALNCAREGTDPLLIARALALLANVHHALGNKARYAGYALQLRQIIRDCGFRDPALIKALVPLAGEFLISQSLEKK